MRHLAIDLGTKRVGLALSDAGGAWASPLEVLEVRSSDDALRQVLEQVEDQGVQVIVVGLPLNMDDSIGPMARQVAQWGRSLVARCGLPLVFVDERLSSFAAEQQLSDRKRGGERITRQQKKRRLDAHAAAGFLQAYLDGKLAPISLADD